RMFHSIKGASVVMGFESVKSLTHNLESLFEQLRAKKRTLDRRLLDLTFRCLDELRDYHRELRAGGQSSVDLATLTPEVIKALEGPYKVEEPAAPPSAAPTSAPSFVEPASPPASGLFEGPERTAVTVVFEPNLALADMKARLVLNRLAG